MLFYAILFFIIFILTFIEVISPIKIKKRIVLSMLSILFCVSGFRYLGGSDLYLYEEGYNSVPYLFSMEFVDYIGTIESHFWEPGFLVFISFWKSVFNLSFYGLLLIVALLFYVCLYVGYKRYSVHWGILLMFFMYKLFFYETFVAMRQQISICLFFLIMHLVEERKLLKYYLLCAFVVFPFHYGSAILFLVYFVNKIKITKERFLYTGLLLLPFAFLPPIFSSILQPIMTFLSEDKGTAYLSGDEMQSMFYTLETYLVWFLIYRNYDGITKGYVHAEFMIKLFLIILPCVTIFRDVVILRREMDYFYLCIPVLIGYICNVNLRYKRVIILVMAFVCFYGYMRYLTNFDNGGFVPYKSWIELPGASITQ